MRILKDYKKAIKVKQWEIRVVDVLILGVLIASSWQMAISFGGSTSAYIKAFSFDGFVLMMSRGISSARHNRILKAATWTALIIMMTITCAANIYYEWMKAIKFTAITLEKVLAIDILVQVWAVIVSGFLPLIILGMTMVRSIFNDDLDQLHASQVKLEKSRDYRKRKEEREQQKIAEQQGGIFSLVQKANGE